MNTTSATGIGGTDMFAACWEVSREIDRVVADIVMVQDQVGFVDLAGDARPAVPIDELRKVAVRRRLDATLAPLANVQAATRPHLMRCRLRLPPHGHQFRLERHLPRAYVSAPCPSIGLHRRHEPAQTFLRSRFSGSFMPRTL